MKKKQYSLQQILTIACGACLIGVIFGVADLLKSCSREREISQKTFERKFDAWQDDNLPERVSFRQLASCTPIGDAGLYLDPDCPVCRMEVEACTSLIFLAYEPIERRRWQIAREEVLLRSCDSLLSTGTASRLDSAARDLRREKISILSRMNAKGVNQELVNTLQDVLEKKRDRLERLSEKDGYRIEFLVRLHEEDSTTYRISFVKGVEDKSLTFVGFTDD